MKTIRIVIFAKAPHPGFAKTRLIPALGSQGAANLARRLLDNTLNTARAANVGPIELCVTPSILDKVWQNFTLTETEILSEQADGDLGKRLAHAAKRVTESGESILLIGTDCPELCQEALQRAAQALQSADATLIPTADGGYALLGLNRFHPSLFEGITWSTNSVAFETLCRLSKLGWSVCNHPMLHDIDQPDDLKWLPENWIDELDI